HPNLVAVYELALDPARDLWFLAMEHVPADSWSAALYPPGRPALPTALRPALAQLAAGVHALHRAGLLHRDLKPSNVLLSAAGRLKIVDFGLATLASGGEQALAGTEGYLAPELLLGAAASPASDWFAVGVMLHEALTGARPRLPLAPAPLGPEVPADLDALCQALLASDPSSRPSGPEILHRLGVAVPAAPAAPTFVGRDHERAAGLDALARGPALLLLVGASGAGKSALLTRLLADLRRDRDALVLRGRCYAGETVPYKALDGVIDALAQHLVTCPSEHVPLDSTPEAASAL